MTTPVYNPWSAMARTAANRSDEAGTPGSIFLLSPSSAVVMVIIHKTGEWVLISW